MRPSEIFEKYNGCPVEEFEKRGSIPTGAAMVMFVTMLEDLHDEIQSLKPQRKDDGSLADVYRGARNG